MSEIFYTKKNGKYTPVASGYCDHPSESFPKGASLVIVGDNFMITKRKIDPELAPLIAASVCAKKDMIAAIRAASEVRATNTVITEEEKEAWNNLKRLMGDSRFYLQYPSANDIAEAGVEAMQKEAARMITHPAVKAAYEQFLIMWKLTKEKENE